MQRIIAFLGGINVGGHRLKMADLRLLFEALGLANVSTFIASGNVIFDSASPDLAQFENQIEDHLKQALGYRVPTFLRTGPELAAIALYEPFQGLPQYADFQSLFIMFLKSALGAADQQKLLEFQTPSDAFHVHQREIYWLCQKNMSESLVDWPLLNKQIAMPPVTVRNVNTVRKIAKSLAY